MLFDVMATGYIAEVALCCDVIFLSLSESDQVHGVCISPDITHYGRLRVQQVFMSLENMLLFNNFVSIVETLLMIGRAKLGSQLLVYTPSKGSADGFTLRANATKGMLSDNNPEDVFSVRYDLKNLNYALKITPEPGINAQARQLMVNIPIKRSKPA